LAIFIIKIKFGYLLELMTIEIKFGYLLELMTIEIWLSAKNDRN